MPPVFDSFDADMKACRALLRGGSKSFDMAAKLLPASVRDPAVALYAFCREADDVPGTINVGHPGLVVFVAPQAAALVGFEAVAGLFLTQPQVQGGELVDGLVEELAGAERGLAHPPA